MKTIRIPYKSGWFTVVIPTLTFLFVWFGLSFLILGLLRWSVSDWLGMLICGSGIVPGFVTAWAVYPVMLRLAERGGGEIALDGFIVRWRSARRWHKMDLAQSHRAKIAADEGMAMLSLSGENDLVNIHVRGLTRTQVLSIFPTPHFIDTLVVTPAMGSWGFEFGVENPEVEDFALALLKALWEQRHQNRYFLLYEKFPWEREPRPAFDHVRVIVWEHHTPEEEALIRRLQEQFIDGLTDSYVRLTPDYLVAWVYKSLWSNLSGHPDYYYLMPLGHIDVEVSLPQPDWKPFIVGHMVVEALEELGGSGATYGPPLEHRHYLYVRGRDAHSAPLEMAFDWYGPADEEYDEAQWLVQFVQARQHR